MPTILQWVKKLEAQINSQARYSELYERRYDNRHVLPFIAAEYRDVYGARADGLLVATMEAPRAGMAATVVDALTQRLTLSGWSSDDKDTARALESVWLDSDLDVMHREAPREALISARSFGATQRSASDSSKATVTIESCTQAAVHRMQGPPYDVDAYLKISVDEWTGVRTALLQLDGEDIHLTEGDEHGDPQGSDVRSKWHVNEDGIEARFGPVPVVEFAHRPRLTKPPTSEIERLVTMIDLGDLIEGLTVFAGHFGAVPIRYGTGLTVLADANGNPILDSNGKPQLGFKPRADHFWGTTSEKAQFGQLTPATLSTFTEWANHNHAQIRRQTLIASTYFALDVKSHMSAELLKTDEAPMVRRVLEMGRDGVLNQAWRKLGGHVARIENLRGRVMPQWTDPNTRLEAQSVDAFQKAVASGVPIRIAAEKFLGWSPDLAEKVEKAAKAEQQELIYDPMSLLPAATRANLKAVPNADAGAGGSA